MIIYFFNCYSMKNNLPKNRYNDVLCYDHSRVCLQRQDESDICSDYINANFVDGYKEKNAFISTQGNKMSKFDFVPIVWILFPATLFIINLYSIKNS